MVKNLCRQQLIGGLVDKCKSSTVTRKHKFLMAAVFVYLEE